MFLLRDGYSGISMFFHLYKLGFWPDYDVWAIFHMIVRFHVKFRWCKPPPPSGPRAPWKNDAQGRRWWTTHWWTVVVAPPSKNIARCPELMIWITVYVLYICKYNIYNYIIIYYIDMIWYIYILYRYDIYIYICIIDMIYIYTYI